MTAEGGAPLQWGQPRIAPDAFVAPGAVVLGDVQLGAQSSLWYGVIARGDVNFIRIGARTNIQDGTIIHVARRGPGDPGIPTLIGDDITVGHGAILHACTVEDGAFIGMRATLLDGSHVEAGAMIAAGALLTPGKRVPAGQLWGGSPARFMRALTDADHAAMEANTAHYVRLAARHRALA